MKRVFYVFLASLAVSALAFSPVFSQENEAGEEKVKEEKAKGKTGVFTIGEIVVRDRALASIEDAGTTTEVTAEDIEARGDRELADSLKQVPGASVEISAKGSTRFSLRGYDQDMVAIMVDGIPVFDPYEASIDISQIPAYGVSKIVVNKGVSSALYGANGIVGAVNVVTMKPEEMYAKVSAEYGQYNNYTLNISQGAPIGKFYYWLTGMMSNSDGYEISGKLTKSERKKWINKLSGYDLYGTATDDVTDDADAYDSMDQYVNDTGKWDHTSYRKYQVSGKAGYEINKDMEAGFSAMYFNKEQESNTFQMSALSSWDQESDQWEAVDLDSAFSNRAFVWPEYYSYSFAPYFNMEKGAFTLKANTFIYQQVDVTLGYANTEETEFMWPAAAKYWTGTKNKYIFDEPYKSKWTNTSYGVNVYPSYKFSEKNRINAAISFRIDNHMEEEKAESGSTTIIAEMGSGWYDKKELEEQMLTVAVEDEMKFTDSLAVTAGVSYDAQNLTKYDKLFSGDTEAERNQYGSQYEADDDSMIWGTRDAFSPVLGAVYEPVKNYLKVRAAASVKTKFPTLADYADIDEDFDEKVDPEKSYNFNTGAEVAVLGEALNVRADYFYSQWDDKIESVTNSDGDDISLNVDGVRSQGIELAFSGKSPRLLNLFNVNYSVSYVFTYAKNLDNSDNSEVNLGDRIADTPMHQFIFDVRMIFVTDTSVTLFGTYERNAITYAQDEVPATTDSYSTSYFEEVELHDPLKINIKISQKFANHFEAYVKCDNVLDDYNANPLNPGPGRMFYIGGSAEL